MVLKTLYIIELTDTEEGGLELVDPSWCKSIFEPKTNVIAAHCEAVSHTATSEMTAPSVDFETMNSDQQSEFSEWSGSRKSSLFPGLICGFSGVV
uniref:Uncharacterized protein n=1 Tax=Caenorhabditis japonica TaxID=281687 RepID=A0A8R1ITW9_CAEJA